MSREDEIAAGMKRLEPLLGVWEGRGDGDYPTIEAFGYSERTSFVSNGVEPLIAYEQKTWFAGGDNDGSPLHWESGFFAPTGADKVEISNAQNGVRVEVLTGSIATDDRGLRLALDSVVHGHDPRVRSTRRLFRLEGERLRYEVFMATSRHEALVRHLTAELRRVRG